jgi:hypothetical protein
VGRADQGVGRCAYRHGVGAWGYDPCAVREVVEGAAVEAEAERAALAGLQGYAPDFFTGDRRRVLPRFCKSTLPSSLSWAARL